MKQVSVAGKALTVVFAAMFLAACASGPTEEEIAAQKAAEAAAAQEAADAEARRAAEAEAAAKAAMMKELEDAVSAAGSTVYFGFDQYSLTSEAQAILDAHVALAKASGNNVRLEGHTDERGTREYNMALGERRAKAVADYMAGNGVSSYKIETVSYGEERPAAEGSGEANWSQNRRVEIR